MIPAEREENQNIIAILENPIRIEIVKILLKNERLCLSAIAKELYKLGYKIKLPAIVKHVQKLEEAKLLRSESGTFSDEKDARKTIYALQGKERARQIVNQLTTIKNILNSCTTFNETAKLAIKIQTNANTATKEEIEKLKTQIEKCESKPINQYLTEDEKRNLKLWKMMLTISAPERLPTRKTKTPTITETA